MVTRRRGLKVRATIVPTTEHEGRVTHANPLRGVNVGWDGSDRARRRSEAAIVVLLAGPAAQPLRLNPALALLARPIMSARPTQR